MSDKDETRLQVAESLRFKRSDRQQRGSTKQKGGSSFNKMKVVIVAPYLDFISGRSAARIRFSRSFLSSTPLDPQRSTQAF